MEIIAERVNRYELADADGLLSRDLLILKSKPANDLLILQGKTVRNYQPEV
jgi:hypothetical protein